MENCENRNVVIWAWLVVLWMLSVRAELDLEPQLKWDACKITKKSLRTMRLYENISFVPPACTKNYSTTDYGDCQCVSCLSKVTNNGHEIGYHRCSQRGNDLYYSYTCDVYPSWPQFVTVLDMSGDSIKRRQAVVDPDFLNASDLANIHSLILYETSFNIIADRQWEILKNIECINLDRARFFDLVSLVKLLYLPTLKRLSERQMQRLGTGPRITAEFVSRFSLLPNNSNIESLWLSGNNIEGKINPEVFRSFSHLKGLDLSYNAITNDKLFASRSLEALDLSFNSLSEFPESCYLRESLKEASSNNFSAVCPNLLRLDVSTNRITHIFEVDTALCLPKLQFLDLSRNYIFAIENIFFERLPVLQVLNLKFQNIGFLDLMYYYIGTHSLLELHLENHNNIRFDTDKNRNKRFSNISAGLQKVFLDGSNLQLVDEITFVDIFGGLRQLQTLSLSGTKLDFVSEGMFAHFPNLSALILSDNAITTIPDGCFDVLTHLSSVDLSGNKITVVREQTFGLPLRLGLVHLSFAQNPLWCDCELLWFRDWFVSQPTLFGSSDDYRCHNLPAKSELAKFTLKSQACLLTREMSSMIIFSCTVIIITLTTITLVFRYRWHLRLILYEAFRGRDDARRRRLEQGRFAYDVFVSYASEDLTWVRQHLLPQLQESLGLRLCIHDTDFIPGKNIVDNIVDCVENSKRILMVFTKDFVRSQWCQFELNFCLRHVLENEDALVVVCVDDVMSREMTSAMMAVLKTTTYIQWADEADAVRSFWGRVQMALEEVIGHDDHLV